jgi:hypothetical protein
MTFSFLLLSGLLGSGYTLKGNPARFLLPETDNLSPAAAISGKLDNWPANSNTSVIGASKALRPSANNNRQNGKKGKRRVIKKKGKIHNNSKITIIIIVKLFIIIT